MRRKADGWNVVLAGFWNRMIFTPEWVGTHLFPGEEHLEIVVALLPVMPVIYRDGGVTVEIAQTRIMLRPRNVRQEVGLRRAGRLASVILQDLPQTPLQGIGINFGFVEERPLGRLLNLFNFADAGALAGAEWDVTERKVTRKLARAGETLNLSVTLSEEKAEIDFNFHSEAQSNEAARAAVAEDRIVRLRDVALGVLGAVYGLELEGDENA